MHNSKGTETNFIDVGNWDWDTDVVRTAMDRDAVQRYFEALENGSLGQAIRERYAFDGPLDFSEGISSIDELVISDLQENLDDDDYRLDATRYLLAQGLGNTDDPGTELIRKMVGMIDADSPAMRRRKALRGRLLAFLEENELGSTKVDKILDIMLN